MPSSSAAETRGNCKIAVFGMGHVGLPTALGFAELGWNVIGADNDASKITRLKNGECHFFEPGMQELLSVHLNGRFTPTASLEEAVKQATILFVCVGTPQTTRGEADMSQVEALARIIARNSSGYKLVVEKSTVPAITGQWVRRTLQRHSANGLGNGNGQRRVPAEFDVASNPEFLQEGKAIENFFHPDRIVCGVTSARARALLRELYREVAAPLLFTDLTTAELIKHSANAFLAMKVSFINLVADTCERVGADVGKVAAGIGLDPRIGQQFLQAGLGFGGYCLPKDLRAFTHLVEMHDVDSSLLRAVDAINVGRIDNFVTKLRNALWVLQGKCIAVFGLAFKAGTDDIRESPALRVIERLLAEGATIRAYDPKAIENARREMAAIPGRLTYHEDQYEAAEGADAVAITTDWPEFGNMDLDRLKSIMQLPILIDGRNVLDPSATRSAGFECASMGRIADTHWDPQNLPKRPARKLQTLAA